MSDPSFPNHKPKETPSNVLSRRLQLPHMAKQIRETTSGLLHSYSSHGTDVMEDIGVGVVEVYMLIGEASRARVHSRGCDSLGA